ncbi:MAG: efflux RND transporter periplasmic adaptor subunit [Deltaproteobacteria bacterium]|nr:efflux RND transporter periplasmic adaptor subunit [Deltaproteobacteria bacterium]
MRLSRFLMLLAFAGMSACSSGDSAPPPAARRPPAPVLVATAEKADVPVELRALGTVEPMQSTPIRAQIGGTIMEVRFREGEAVKAGQVLFQIDPRPYENTVRQLQADLARLEAQARTAEAQVGSASAQVRTAEAQASYAEAQVKRYAELVQKDYVTRAEYDQQRTNAEATRAAVDASRATVEALRATAQAAREAIQSTRVSVENAKLQLSYTTIRSPVSGQTGSLSSKAGDLVKANDTQLVTINQLQPILVRFTVPEGSLPELQKYRRQGTLRVTVTAPGTSEPRHGRLVFLDNAVDPTTATIALKAEFQNADRALWPGQFVEVKLVLYTRRDAVVVPTQAIQTGQQGPYVFVVEEGNTASIRPVQPADSAGERTVIEKGLRPGETVVTDGQLRLTPGAKVAVREGLVPARGGRPGGDGHPGGRPPARAADRSGGKGRPE